VDHQPDPIAPLGTRCAAQIGFEVCAKTIPKVHQLVSCQEAGATFM
uniref:Uncharacterized protein n=1 Tax=Triticum urartu TaxID=4572 RepID=A0A8R7Q2H8_TRIUA